MALDSSSTYGINIRPYRDERDLPEIIAMISKDLSEPYSIYVYRYFIHQWPELCFVISVEDELIGTIVCKLEDHRGLLRGYIAMLAIKEQYRGHGYASMLVARAIQVMREKNGDEVCLEAEVTNRAAMKLYENMGFLRSKLLHRYYLSANDAFRYILPLK